MAEFRRLMASMDEDTRNFISSMEHKAKKILEKSNKRRVLESQRQLQDAVRETRRDRKNRRRKGQSPRSAPEKSQKWDWLDGADGSASAADNGQSTDMVLSSMAGPSSNSRAASPAAATALVPLQSMDDRAIAKRRHRLGSDGKRRAGKTSPRSRSRHQAKKLQAMTLNPSTNLANNHKRGAQNLTHGGQTHTFRPDHALDARKSKAQWLDPNAKTNLESGLRSLPRIRAMGKDIEIKVDPLEPQGPTNWSSDDLRFKYRDEHGRQLSHQASKNQVEEAERLQREQGIIVPAVRIEEHPNWVHIFEVWREENKRATERSRRRNRAKVFGLDIKALWRAHKPPKLKEAKLFAVAKSLQRRHDMNEIAAGQHQVQSVSALRAFENAIVSPLEKLRGSLGAVKMIKKLRKKMSASEEAAGDGVELTDEEKKFFAPDVERYEPWARLSRYFKAETLAYWSGVPADSLPDSRWVIIKLERSQNFVRAQITDVSNNLSFEVIEPRKTVEWAMGGEFEANKPKNFAERLEPILPPADLESKPFVFNRLSPQRPPTSFFVSGFASMLNEVPGIGVAGSETFKVKQALRRNEQKIQRGDHTQPIMYHFDTNGLVTARFYRDSKISKTDSVMVCLAASLELTLLHPLTSAWESVQLVAEFCEEEMTDNIVSDAIAPYRHREISSNVSQWLPKTLFLLSAAAASSDCRFNIPGHRRYAEIRNDSGFRQILRVQLRPLDPVVEPFPFGITERASIPSVPSVWPRRYSYHSEDLVTGLSPRDHQHYLYVLKAQEAAGYPDPLSFSIMMRGYTYDRLRTITRTQAVLIEDAAQRLVEEIHASIAAAAKLQEGQEYAKSREAKKKMLQYQKAIKDDADRKRMQGKIQKGTGAGAWERRKEGAVQVAQWRNPEGEKELWTKWQSKTGALFYKKEYPHTGYQWDPPLNWGQRAPAAAHTGGGNRLLDGSATGGGQRSLASMLQRGVQGGPGEVPSDMETMISMLATNPKFVGMLALKLGLKRDDDSDSDSEDDGPMGASTNGQRKLPQFPFYKAGDRVESRYLGGTQFWPGRVMRVNQDQSLDIVYDLPDMFEKEVPIERIRRIKELKKPPEIPLLKLSEAQKAEDDAAVAITEPSDVFEHNMNWRLMKADRVPSGFVSRCKKPRIGVPLRESPVDSFPDLSTPGLLDPAEFVEENDIEKFLAVQPRVEVITNITIDSLRYAMQLGDDLGNYEELAGDRRNDGSIVEDEKTKKERELAEYTRKCFAAVQNHQIEDVEEYLDYGVLPQDARDENGNYLLHIAVQQGSKRLAKFLLRRGAVMNAQNNRGNTVLHYAFYYNYEELGEYLISKGADDTIVNADGLTCYEGLDKEVLQQL